MKSNEFRDVAALVMEALPSYGKEFLIFEPEDQLNFFTHTERVESYKPDAFDFHHTIRRSSISEYYQEYEQGGSPQAPSNNGANHLLVDLFLFFKKDIASIVSRFQSGRSRAWSAAG
jgi:hypothetical protein